MCQSRLKAKLVHRRMPWQPISQWNSLACDVRTKFPILGYGAHRIYTASRS